MIEKERENGCESKRERREEESSGVKAMDASDWER